MLADLQTMATAAPVAVQIVLPIDVVALVQALFYGVSIVCAPVATIYVMVGAQRAKRAEIAAVESKAVSNANNESLTALTGTVNILEKNTNSISTRNEAIARKLGIQEGLDRGKARANEAADTLAAGQRQGASMERESAAAANHSPAAGIPQEAKQ